MVQPWCVRLHTHSWADHGHGSYPLVHRISTVGLVPKNAPGTSNPVVFCAAGRMPPGLFGRVKLRFGRQTDLARDTFSFTGVVTWLVGGVATPRERER